jgi:hypothetical protein
MAGVSGWPALTLALTAFAPLRVATALRHSFTCAAAYAATDAPPPLPGESAAAADAAAPPRRVLVGFARPVSVRETPPGEHKASSLTQNAKCFPKQNATFTF